MDKIISSVSCSVTSVIRRLNKRTAANNRRSYSFAGDRSVRRTRQEKMCKSSSYCGEENIARQDSSEADCDIGPHPACDSVSSKTETREASLSTPGLDIRLIKHNLNLPPPAGSYCVAKYE